MASSTPHGSKEIPHTPPLALPRQRPTLALPGQQSRKTSITSSTTPSHPLRQTSFPPQDNLPPDVAGSRRHATFSPSESLDDVSDGEINSVISAPVNEENSSKKRKRGDKRTRGKPSKATSGRLASLVPTNVDDTRSLSRRSITTPSRIATGEDGEAEEEDEDEDEDASVPGGRLPLYEGGQMTTEEINIERERKRSFYDSVPEIHRDRSEAYHRAKLRTADVRRLVNQTLSQSVPQNVVLVVASYTKLFAGILIEEARAVQAEWMAAEELLASQRNGPSLKQLHISHAGAQERPTIHGRESDSSLTPELSPSKLFSSGQDYSHERKGPDGLIQTTAECDRGPLLPDHLRAALRRYKKSMRGGPVGFTGLSLEGRDLAAPRMGGRKLFR